MACSFGRHHHRVYIFHTRDEVKHDLVLHKLWGWPRPPGVSSTAHIIDSDNIHICPGKSKRRVILIPSEDNYSRIPPDWTARAWWCAYVWRELREKKKKKKAIAREVDFKSDDVDENFRLPLGLFDEWDGYDNSVYVRVYPHAPADWSIPSHHLSESHRAVTKFFSSELWILPQMPSRTPLNLVFSCFRVESSTISKGNWKWLSSCRLPKARVL